MSRTGKIISWTVGVIAVLIVALVILIATFDWNRLKPVINRKVSAEINRPFAIRGDLGVAWEQNPDEKGWHRWIPWPHIHAQDIVLGNPPAIPEATMVHLERVEATISPLALAGKEVWLPWIRLKQPQANLIQTADGKNNWTFELADSDKKEADKTPSAWSFRLDNVVFDQGTLGYRDAINQANVKVSIDPLGKPIPYAQLAGAMTSRKARLTSSSAGVQTGRTKMRS